VLAVGALVVGFIFWVTGDPIKPPVQRKPTLEGGKVLDAPITLLAADKFDLACASDLEWEGYRCEFKKDGESWPGVEVQAEADRKKMLAPYMTVDNTLFLIPGLFEDTAVDERYRYEAPRRASRDKQERFTAQCKLTLRHVVEAVKIRWSPNDKWQQKENVWIGEVSQCQVGEP